MKTYRPLPIYLTIMPSSIEGLGLFCIADIEKDTYLGVSHIIKEQDEIIRTPLGGFYNHSDDPNCEKVLHNDRFFLRAIKDIKAGNEITVSYTLYEPKI